jgi:hypothetical protein
MHSKMMRYDRAVRKLNEARKEGSAFAVVSAFGDASVGGNADPVSSLGDLSLYFILVILGEKEFPLVR